MVSLAKYYYEKKDGERLSIELNSKRRMCSRKVGVSSRVEDPKSSTKRTTAGDSQAY